MCGRARCHLGLGAVLGRGRSPKREPARRATDLFKRLGIERGRREPKALSIELAG
jgi:hypothetical protein